MFRRKGRKGQDSAEPLPTSSGESYITRYRGTEWDTGFGLKTEDTRDVTVSALTGFLVVALAFVIFVVLWMLLSGRLA